VTEHDNSLVQNKKVIELDNSDIQNKQKIGYVSGKKMIDPKKQCLVCGKQLGPLMSKVKCADGAICLSCLQNMGFPKLNMEAIRIVNNSPLSYIRASGFDQNEMYLPTKQRISNMIVRNPGIGLKNDDICFYMAYAYIGKQVTRTTGYKTSGLRTNIHIMKGVNYRVGNINVTPQKETHWEKIPCRFFVTKDRIIALADKGSFDIKMEKAYNLTLHADSLIIYTGSKTHVIFLNQIDQTRFRKFHELVQLAISEGIKMEDFL
jgi:hypothetical protein